jgi:hypothetical protein
VKINRAFRNLPKEIPTKPKEIPTMSSKKPPSRNKEERLEKKLRRN